MESQTNKLLQKYWEGKTSVDEEKAIKNSFAKTSEKSFEGLFFEELKKRKSVEGAPTFVIPKQKTKLLWKLSSVAATIIILIALSIGFFNSNDNNKYAINDPKEAYEISQQALMMVSAKLNKGKIYSENLDRINDVKQIINK